MGGIHLQNKGAFPAVAFFILVLALTAGSLQKAEAGSVCSFTVVSTGGGAGQLSNGITVGVSNASEKPLSVSGNPILRGSCGGIHTNGDLKISGDTWVDQNVTYSGTLEENKADCGGDLCGVRAAAVDVPQVNPNDFAAYVDYQLRADGRVYESDGAGGWVSIARATSNKWNGWSYSSPKWVMDGDSTVDGSFFVEGDVEVSSNVGSQSDPWEVSFFATGYIMISGNPVAVTNPNNAPQLGNFLYAAGTDLKINGNQDQSFQGIMAAHEQIMVSGNPGLEGCFIAEDAASYDGLVSENTFSGDFVLECYDCSLPSEDQILTITEPF